MALKLKLIPKTTVKKKTAAQLLDETRKLNKASAALSKSGGSTVKATTGAATKSVTAKTSTAIPSGTVKTSGTTATPAKYSTPAAKGTDSIPNTLAGVIKKPGVLATFTAGGLIGALGTALGGAANSISSGINEIIPEDEPLSPLPDGSIIPYHGGGDGGIIDDLNDEASELLDPLSDTPILGDAITAAEEGGWSALLLVGLVIAGIAAAVFTYKKLNGKKPARKTTKRKGKK